MILLEDTGQQANKHNEKHLYFASRGVEVRRQSLYVGDYTLPTDQSICIDTKKGLQEVVNNVCGADHKRFRNECIRAKEAGIKLIVLVEEDQTDENGRYVVNDIRDVHKWQNPRRKTRVKKDGQWVMKYPKATTGAILKKAMITMSYRYGVRWEFCRKRDAGRMILELLNVKGMEEG